jgi:hypothetical protein
MSNALQKLSLFLRGRWSRVCGRCPLCNRKLHAAFPYYMTAHPHCPACKDETETDMGVGHEHRTLVSAP